MNDTNEVLDGDVRFVPGIRTAGGDGAPAARQSALRDLRRLTCSFLLWDNPAYTDSASNRKEIQRLVKACNPQDVADLAVEIRKEQGLRHTPLFLIRELFRRPEARIVAGQALPKVIQRADEITAFLDLYWKDGKVPLAAQVKKGLAQALNGFGAYALAKWKEDGKSLSLRDVLHLVHAKPKDVKQGLAKWTKAERKAAPLRLNPTEGEVLFHQLSSNTLPTPQTREVLLSQAKNDLEKKQAYETLLSENQLGAQALLMNLAGMDKLGVDQAMIRNALVNANPRRILPLQFFSAATAAPRYKPEINALMRKSLLGYSKLPGKTVMIVDMSGSMRTQVSAKSQFTRADAAQALAVMAKEVCEDFDLYLTAGDHHTHKTVKVTPTARGFDMVTEIEKLQNGIGGGGIFTRQALDFVKNDLGAASKEVTRIMVVSDSQDCDRVNKVPAPFAKYNYIIDVSANQYGINYKGVWTQEITGWSQHFIEYVAMSEAGYQDKLF